MPMRLVLIRHAQSVGNAESRLQGHADYPLSDAGRAQAALLRERLRAERAGALYTSPLLRAQQTAAIAADGLGPAITPLPAVMEYDFGAVSGLTMAQIREQYPDLAALQRAGTAEDPSWPGEEGREVFRERVCSALWRLEERHRDETVAVVTHGGPIVVFLLSVLDLAFRRPIPFSCDNASISIVQVRDGHGVILSLNDTCHLDR